MLDDGDDELAWHSVSESPEADLGEHTWLRLAEARQKTHRPTRSPSTGGSSTAPCRPLTAAPTQAPSGF